MEQVLIVGAGPTGLTVAMELRRWGVAAVLYDRLAEGRNTSRAVVVQARTMEVLEPAGVTAKMLEEGTIIHGFHVRDRDRLLATIDLSDSGLETKYPFALILPQDRTEALLLAELERLGGSVTRPAQAKSLRAAEDGIELDVERDGQSETVAAQWIVACDGQHSVVREAAGIAFEGGEYDEEFVLADVDMDWPPGHGDAGILLSGGGIVVVVPLPGSTARYRIIATVKELAPENPDAALFERILHERGPSGSKHITAMHWSSRFHIHHRVAQQLRRGRVILAGDAAHVHSPAGGQGMNTGIQDATSLAEALAETLRTGDKAPLTAWETKRLAVAHDVVRLTDRLTRAATDGSRSAEVVRNVALFLVAHFPPARHAAAERLSELIYR